MISLPQARDLLPDDMKSIPDSDLTSLMASLYSLADLSIDRVLEREGGDISA